MDIAERLLAFRPPRIAMFLLSVAIIVHAVLPPGQLPRFPVAAGLLGTAGFAVMIRAWWLFQIADTAICPTDLPSRLLTHDVFRISRNPMYLGMVAMLVAVALYFGTLPFYVVGAGFAVLLDRAFCVFEEQLLEQEFGAAYADYKRRVRRWL